MTTTERALAIPGRDQWVTLREEAETLLASGFLPAHVKSAAQAIAIAMVGRELGVSAWRALTGIKVIQGTPTLSSELMAQLIYQDHGPNALDIEETTSLLCTISYQRRGASERRRYTYTMEMAKVAGLANNPNYHKHPANMLRARCISNIARMAFPDTIAGCYSEDEGEEIAANRTATAQARPTITDHTVALEGDYTEQRAVPVLSAAHADAEQRSAAMVAEQKAATARGQTRAQSIEPSPPEIVERWKRIRELLATDPDPDAFTASLPKKLTKMDTVELDIVIDQLEERALEAAEDSEDADAADHMAEDAEDASEAPDPPALDPERRSRLNAYVDGVQVILDRMKGTRGPLKADQIEALCTVYKQGCLLVTGAVTQPATAVDPKDLVGLIATFRAKAGDELRAAEVPATVAAREGD